MLNELNRTSSILRDLFDDSFTGVYSNNKDLCYEVKDEIKKLRVLVNHHGDLLDLFFVRIQKKEISC